VVNRDTDDWLLSRLVGSRNHPRLRHDVLENCETSGGEVEMEVRLNRSECPIQENGKSGMAVLDDLAGSTIVKAGLVDYSRLDSQIEGGFVIDYRKDGVVSRVVLGFTELGMWVDWNGVKGQKNERDLLFDRMLSFYRSYLEDDFGADVWSINDKPLERRYSFVKNGHEYLSLSIKELREMGMARLFGQMERDIGEITSAIYQWFCINCPNSFLEDVAENGDIRALEDDLMPEA